MVIDEKAFVFKFLDENDSYPYSLGRTAHGIQAINNDANTELIITLTYTKGQTIDIPVPGGTTYEGRFIGFDTINTSGSSNYNIGIVE